MHDIHLADRESEQVHAEGRAGALQNLPRAVPEDLSALRSGPGHARVEKESRLDGQNAVVAAARSEDAEQRETELHARHQDAATEHLVDDRAADCGGSAFDGV